MTGSKAAHPRISIIVAYAENRVIGKAGSIPWRISEDLKRFRQLTMGHHIVMGRKTWESIGRILPGRKHIIISRKPGYTVTGAKVVDSLNAAIAAARGDNEIFVIGGSEIYALVLPIADRILATEIDRKYEGDTYFPELEKGIWRETARELRHGEADGFGYSYVTYEHTRDNR
ncbi:MAG TPA: dihydrofolate reductase [Burkholderiales bacterium]|nr:dihydrofolate reductase [Burkholderiales bacterium]